MKTLILGVFAILFSATGMCQTTGTGTGSSAGNQSSNNQQTITHPPTQRKSRAKVNDNSYGSNMQATNSRNNGLHRNNNTITYPQPSDSVSARKSRKPQRTNKIARKHTSAIVSDSTRK